MVLHLLLLLLLHFAAVSVLVLVIIVAIALELVLSAAAAATHGLDVATPKLFQAAKVKRLAQAVLIRQHVFKVPREQQIEEKVENQHAKHGA
jgi:hypothetical protein